MQQRSDPHAAVVEALHRVAGGAVGRQEDGAAAGHRDRRAEVALLRFAVVAGGALFDLIEDRAQARRRLRGAGVAVTAGRRRVQEPVDRFAVRVSERVGRARFGDGDFGFEGVEESLIARCRAAVMVELRDVHVAGELTDPGFDVRRLLGAGAAAAGEVARDDEVEVVVLDEQADGCGVEILVGDRHRPAAEQPAADHEAGGAHAAAEIDHLTGRDGRAHDAGGGDRVLVGGIRPAGGTGQARRNDAGSVAVVVGDSTDTSGGDDLGQAGVVIDVVVGEDRVVDGRDAQRIQRRDDLRGAGARRAAIDEQRLAGGRHDQGAGSGPDVDEIDSRGSTLCLRALHRQDEDETGERREVLGHEVQPDREQVPPEGGHYVQRRWFQS